MQMQMTKFSQWVLLSSGILHVQSDVSFQSCTVSRNCGVLEIVRNNKCEACAAGLTPNSDRTGCEQPPFFYRGSFDGVCQAPSRVLDDALTLTKSARSLEFTNLGKDSGGHAQAEANCNSIPNCVGYGTHYEIDRYYIARATKANTLYCQDPENDRCGSGHPTNGCRVRFDSATNAPYVAPIR